MADSIEDGATIRIGFRECDTKIKEEYVPVPTYSLKIHKKTVLNVAFGGIPKDYLDIYRTAAIKISELMKNQHIKKYVIYNGERIRTDDKKWTNCAYVPKNGEEIFRRTLENYLN
jgi:hypothetical protein